MAQYICCPHMEGIMPALGWDKLRNNNCNCLIWLAINKDLFQVFEQRFDKHAKWRIKNNQTRSLAPGLPLLLYFFGFSRVQRNMDSRHIIGEKFCITQGFQRALMDSTDRHDHTVARVASR